MRGLDKYIDRSKNTAIVCHDAGGANQISHSLSCTSIKNVGLFLKGPAIKIFNERFHPIEYSSELKGLQNYDQVICGTGWQTNFEWEAMNIAKKQGYELRVVLDHWTAYNKRCTRNQKTITPDEVIVVDEYAYKIAKAVYIKSCITQINDDYTQETVNTISKQSSERVNTGSVVLFVGENLTTLGIDHEEVIKKILNNNQIQELRMERMIVRPHPSDDPQRFKNIISEFSCLELSCSPLTEDIAKSDVVIGYSSKAMVVALAAGKRVLSCVFDDRVKLTLPHKGIKRLFDK